MQTKAELRMAICQQKSDFSSRQNEEASAMICEILRNFEPLQKSRSLAIFAPLPDEPNITPIIKSLFTNKQVALPRIGELDECDFAWAESLADLPRDKFGIVTPLADAEAAKTLDLILVPAVAIDKRGNRLGRGKGVYDRLLAESSAIKIAVIFDYQFVRRIATEEHDVAVDGVITEHGLQLFD
jgi:5-formyltetrahydrofolate cyclo-ligase